MQSKAQNNLILAADIGATNFRMALFTLNLEMIEKKKVLTPRTNFVQTIREELKDFIGQNQILGIALSLAGPFDAIKNSVKFTNIKDNPELGASNVADLASQIIVLNDTMAALYAENFKKQSKNIVYITISSGIGGAAIKDGKPVPFNNVQQEIGHITLNFNYGVNCGCGGRDHWEAYSSGKNLVNFYKVWTRASNLPSKPFKNAKEIFETAKKGDMVCKRFLSEGFGSINKKALEMIIKKYHPEKIVFGGSVALNNQEEILSEISGIKNLPEIAFTKFSDDISLIGAASYMLQSLSKKC
ncbi:MAG: ROK family protein [Patescibacteria group bacterium]|nr:ROK family protein [Patescibacteria group bacterium]